MKINFVIPTYNESLVIEKNLQTVLDFFAQEMSKYDWRIIVADNGSTDDTVSIAKKLAEENHRLIVWHTDQKGRGHALRRVWQKWPADVCAYMDADLATDLAHAPELVRALASAEVAAGTRLNARSQTSRSLLREISSRVYNMIARQIVRLDVSDTQCGFKALRGETAARLLPLTEDGGWFFDTELLALAAHFGLRVAEVPVRWQEAPDRRRKSSVKIMATAVNYLKQLIKLRRRLARLPKN